MWAIYTKEIHSFLDSLVAYLVVSVFLVLTGLFTWVMPEQSVLDYGFADLSVLFDFGPYILLFLASAITMRSFSEEVKQGTIILLITKPLYTMEVVLAKFLASYTLLIVALAPTLVYVYSMGQLGSPAWNLDLAGIVGSYIGLLLLGAAFTSIGIVASVLSENQLVSFIISSALCLFMYSGVDYLATFFEFRSLADEISRWSISYHYYAMSKGVLDSRNLLFMIGFTAWCIFWSWQLIQKNKS